MTNITTTESKSFDDTVKEITDVIEAAKKQAEVAFFAELMNVFQRYPDIKVLTWTQYTPYFNDGDSCEFSVHDVYYSNYEEVSPWGEWEGEDDEPADFFCEYLGSGKASHDLRGLSKFMGSGVGEEIMQFAFGDHVKVKVTSAGVETDEYEHD